MPAVRPVPVLLAAAAMAIALSGCASGFIDGSIQEGLEDTIEQATDGQAEVDISGEGGAEIPADWPAQVPLPPGDPITSTAFGGTYFVTMRVSSLKVGLDHVAAITTAGFTIESEASSGTGGLWIFRGPGDLKVTYQVAEGEEGDGSAMVGIGVQQEAS